MEKKEIQSILLSMKTLENEKVISELMDKIERMDGDSLKEAINREGATEDNVTKVLQQKIANSRDTHPDEHIQINEMFSYGVKGGCVHLHLPTDLNESISIRGVSKTADLVNLYLLDAIDKIIELRDSGDAKFQGTDSIYIISPILLKSELKFLDDLDFTTKTYAKRELKDESFVKENKEAMLATNIFGNDKNVGTAKISFETLCQKKWQDKKVIKIEEFANRGVKIEGKESKKEETFQEDLSSKVNSIDEVNAYIYSGLEGGVKAPNQAHEENHNGFENRHCGKFSNSPN